MAYDLALGIRQAVRMQMENQLNYWASNCSMPNYKIDDEEAHRLVPSDHLKLHIEGVQVAKARYLEQMAAAFLLETRGVPATDMELVQQELPWPQIGWRFYYRVRKV